MDGDPAGRKAFEGPGGRSSAPSASPFSPFLPKRNVIFIENNAGMNGLTEQAYAHLCPREQNRVRRINCK